VTARGRAAGLALVLAAVGDTLVWSNRDVVPHTATADGGGWNTGSIPAGGERRVVVRE